MNVGAAGALILFFVMIVAEMTVCLVVFTYLAHCFHLVFTSTAAGSDEVTWSSEPMFDWFGEATHLLYMVFMAVVCGIFLFLPLHLSFLPATAGGRMLVGAMVSFWLLFPLFAVSTCTGPSPWLLVFPPVMIRALRRPATMIAVYLASGAMLALTGFIFALALSSRLFVLILLASIMGSAVVLLYARLLGRWTWIVNQEKRKNRARQDKLPIAGLDRRTNAKRKRRGNRSSPTTSTIDPWQLPEIDEVEPLAELPPAIEEEPALRATPSWMDTDLVGYGFAKDEVIERPPQDTDTRDVENQPEALVPKRSVQEQDYGTMEPSTVADRGLTVPFVHKPEPTLDFPLVSGIYTFPLYRNSASAWFRLAFGLLLVTALLALILSAIPRHGDDYQDDEETFGPALPFSLPIASVIDSGIAPCPTVFEDREHLQESYE
jgi:hypothetical protein